MTTASRHEPDRLNAALAYADMIEAVQNGYLETAISLSREHAVPLEEVWSPEDDGIVDEAASTHPSGKKPRPSPPATSTVEANETVHISSDDLKDDNADKGARRPGKR